MSKKMLLLSVPLALLLTACNGSDDKPSAGLPDNNPRTLTATADRNELNAAIDAGDNIAANTSKALGFSEEGVTQSAPKVALQILEAEEGDEDQNLRANLTVDGRTYALREDGDDSNEFFGETDDSFASAALIASPNQQSGVVRYDIETETSGTLGYAAFGALTPTANIPTGVTETATYNGRTQMTATNGQTYNGSATVIANFGASEGDRFNGSEFGLGGGNGTLRVRDGSATHSGNEFSAALNTGGNTPFGANGSGTMNGNFFGFEAEEVAGTLSATGNGVAGVGGFAASRIGPVN